MLKELYEQALRDIQRKDEQAKGNRHYLEETTETLRHQKKLTQEAQSQCKSLEKRCWSKGLFDHPRANGLAPLF